MKIVFLSILFTVAVASAAEKSDILQRLKIAESVFDEKFVAERVERMLSRPIDAELMRLEKVEAARDYVIKIRKLLSDASRAVVTSKAFRNQYTSWLASQLTKAEIESYLEFLRSDLGKKIGDLDDRSQPLLSEALARSGGSLDSIRLLLAEARSKA